jgi:myo-inositol-1(or 4)-monophosphatase
MDPKEMGLFALEIAEGAGQILKKGYRSTFDIQAKGSYHDLVTEYDLKSESYILTALKKKYPSHATLSEESGHSFLEKAEVTWVIDPLDGTNNFAHGLPIFSVSIAAVCKNEVIAGAIVNPITEEAFSAYIDGGAYLNGSKIGTSLTKELDRSFLAVGFPYNIELNPLHCIEQFTRSLHKGMPLRRLGSAAIDLAYVASGRFDGYWETVLSPWDFAAGVLLVKEAGGRVTQIDGSSNTFHTKNSVVASNGLLHEELLSHLRMDI